MLTYDGISCIFEVFGRIQPDFTWVKNIWPSFGRIQVRFGRAMRNPSGNPAIRFLPISWRGRVLEKGGIRENLFGRSVLRARFFM